ncbi:MAG: hypothetical protein JNN12_06400 [Bacteroidetes Order II. Incertae sedis bacterium]|nr:hypothetical protein [Bacteroidetes Order II. bacterium]
MIKLNHYLFSFLLVLTPLWAIAQEGTQEAPGWRSQYRTKARLGMQTPVLEHMPVTEKKSFASETPSQDPNDPRVPRNSANPDAHRRASSSPSHPASAPAESRFAVQLSTPVGEVNEQRQLLEVDTDAPPAHSSPAISGATGEAGKWTEISATGEHKTVSMARKAYEDARVRAFLDVIARGEVGDMGYDEESYKVLHTFKRIKNFTRMHPGIKVKGSTAAGRYQFLRKTFNPMVYRYPSANLTFEPEGQDMATILLLHERGVLSYIGRDDVHGAIRKAAPTWASLPYYDGWGNVSYYRGNGHNRNTMTMNQAIDHYNERRQFWQFNGEKWEPVEVASPLVVHMALAVAGEQKSPSSFQSRLISEPQTITLPHPQPEVSPTPTSTSGARRWRVSQ